MAESQPLRRRRRRRRAAGDTREDVHTKVLAARFTAAVLFDLHRRYFDVLSGEERKSARGGRRCDSGEPRPGPSPPPGRPPRDGDLRTEPGGDGPPPRCRDVSDGPKPGGRVSDGRSMCGGGGGGGKDLRGGNPGPDVGERGGGGRMGTPGPKPLFKGDLLRLGALSS